MGSTWIQKWIWGTNCFSGLLWLNHHKLHTMAISKINNEVYQFIVCFGALKSGILLGSVRIKEHVGGLANIHLFQNVFESIQVRKNLFGKCTLILHFLVMLILLLLFSFCHWLFPENLCTDNMLRIFQHAQNQIRRHIKTPNL